MSRSYFSHFLKDQTNVNVEISSQPITTGTSVIGIKFDGGVMIAADALVSYGSLARFQDVKRVFKVNDQAILGTGGDFADFQSIQRSINDKMVDDICHDDTISLKPKSLYNWLTRILNNRRNKFEPLWLDMVVGGIEDGEPFLGHIDLRGRAYEDDIIATGLGKHLVLPIIREKLVEGRPFTQEQATCLVSNHEIAIDLRNNNILFSDQEVHGSAFLQRLPCPLQILCSCLHRSRS